jgi:hypothetical protein
MNRAAFAHGLSLEANRSRVCLYASTPKRWQLIAAAHRGKGRVFITLSNGLGLTLHRNGGVSVCGMPRTGGTSILWGAVNERVKRHGRDHHSLHLGWIGIYIGADF